jgi:stearoyl-CoA desaturase (Delta-9 desaturase)
MYNLKTVLSKNLLKNVTYFSHVLFISYAFLFGIKYAIISLLISLTITNIVHYLYMHRIYIHKHFKVSNTVHKTCLFLFCSLNLGPPAQYAAIHINHHATSGEDNDPHDPYRLGFLKTVLSLYDSKFVGEYKTKDRYYRDPMLQYFQKNYIFIVLLSVLIMPSNIMFAHWSSKLVIGAVHLEELGYGTKYHNDTSRNVWWLKPILWGEELHNNHHVYPFRANHNVKKTWKEFDLLYHLGKLISIKENV